MENRERVELNNIIYEVDKIVKELDNISIGINNDFRNLGNERCARAVKEVSDHYKQVKVNLQKI